MASARRVIGAVLFAPDSARESHPVGVTAGAPERRAPL